jgi:hypothetical protein
VAPPSLSAEKVPGNLGLLLDRIAISETKLSASDPESYRSYNYLVSRLIDEIDTSGAEPWEQPVQVKGAQRTYTFSAEEPADLRGLGQQLTPTDTLVFSGELAPSDRSTVAGIGAPLIASFPDTLAAWKRSPFLMPRRALTAVVEVRGDRAKLRFLDPFQVEKIVLAGSSRTISADHVSAVSYNFSETRIDKLGFKRMLNPSRYSDTARIDFAQPYDKNRIPVLFVHGLQSTPATWMPM